MSPIGDGRRPRRRRLYNCHCQRGRRSANEECQRRPRQSCHQHRRAAAVWTKPAAGLGPPALFIQQMTFCLLALLANACFMPCSKAGWRSAGGPAGRSASLMLESSSPKWGEELSMMEQPAASRVQQTHVTQSRHIGQRQQPTTKPKVWKSSWLFRTNHCLCLFFMGWKLNGE